MFKVLFAPFEGVTFWRSGLEAGTSAVLAYVRPSCAQVFICVEKGKEDVEISMIEAAAGFLNCSPSLEFTKLMLRSIKDTWKKDLKPKQSKLSRTLYFVSVVGFDQRQPPFAPNNGERLDGYW